MTTEERSPLTCGISRWLLDGNGLIVSARWYRAIDAKEVVGTCRQYKCDGLMVAQPMHEEELRGWFGAECLSCGHEIATRADKPVARRSSRHQEMPAGTWGERLDYLTRMADLAKRKAA